MMSMSGARPGMPSTPPFRERMRQIYGSSPGPSNSPAPPFQSGPTPHSNFTPSKSGKQANPTGMLPKAPKAPEKPLMPYMRYSRKVWDSVKGKNPEMRLWQIGKVIGQMWRELTDTERKEYNDAYEADKAQYQDNLKVYHNSPQYQNYLREKQRVEQMLEEEERRSKSSAVSEHRVSIQPADYETPEDSSLSIKNVASARYHRNHALINEIFSDSLVPDGRSVVTESRMNLLRKQVRSLMEHQQKLEKELGDITNKFTAKKRKFVESSDEFGRKLKEECDNKPVMTSARFDALVLKHKAELRVKYEKMAEQHKQQQERAMAAQATVQQHIQQQKALLQQQHLLQSQTASSQHPVPMSSHQSGQLPPQATNPQQHMLVSVPPQLTVPQQAANPQHMPISEQQQTTPQQMQQFMQQQKPSENSPQFGQPQQSQYATQSEMPQQHIPPQPPYAPLHSQQSSQLPIVPQQGPPVSQQGPPVSQQGPAVSQQGPAGSQQGPAGSQQAPSGSQQAPSGSQGSSTPSLPQHGASVPQHGSSTPQQGSSLPQHGASVPQHGASVPQHGAAVPQHGSSVPQQMPQAPSSTASLQQMPGYNPRYMLSSGLQNPVMNKPFTQQQQSSMQQISPPVQQITSQTHQLPPQVQHLPPQAQLLSPQTQQQLPQVQQLPHQTQQQVQHLPPQAQLPPQVQLPPQLQLQAQQLPPHLLHQQQSDAANYGPHQMGTMAPAVPSQGGLSGSVPMEQGYSSTAEVGGTRGASTASFGDGVQNNDDMDSTTTGSADNSTTNTTSAVETPTDQMLSSTVGKGNLTADGDRSVEGPVTTTE